MFFCPLLPFIGLLKDIVLFYMRSWAVRVFNNAPKHLYRAEATINYYFALLLLLVIAIMFPVGWAVTRCVCVCDVSLINYCVNILHALYLC